METEEANNLVSGVELPTILQVLPKEQHESHRLERNLIKSIEFVKVPLAASVISQPNVTRN